MNAQWSEFTQAMLVVVVIVLMFVLLFSVISCGDDAGACPDSLATSSAEWSAPDARAQCAELADSLNSSGLDVAGDAGDECTGRMSQTTKGGTCHATIASSCAGGLSFELDCAVNHDRTADCEAVIDAPELEHACRLRVLLR